MIPVTKPFVPEKEKYLKYLDSIWESRWLTNMGPLATELEKKLKAHLGVNNLLFVTNGTVALQMAIKALDLKGEIITTPFSFVATTSCIVWEGCVPVFVDVDKDSLCIDATKIEKAITKKTTGILATHVYGNPCDVEKIEEIARKHNLKVIYDGAHAFGVNVKGKSIFEYGDISTCSLHATKLYHSGEGGLVVTNNPELHSKLSSIRNFGISGPDSFNELGINGKNSEFHAAMGLANLDYIQSIHEARKALVEEYDRQLGSLPIVKPVWHRDSKSNYAYYPVLFKSEEVLLKVRADLEKNKIIPRRYFYPSLSSALPYLDKIKMSVSDEASERVLCLPLYHDLKISEVAFISETIKNSLKS